MAKKTVTVLVDDLDGTELPPGTRSTTFAVNGAEYEIDLGPDNVARLDEALGEFIHAARRASSGGTPRKARASSGSGKTPEYLSRVRIWASANGHPVAERGRVKREVLDAFENAQNGSNEAAPSDEQSYDQPNHDEHSWESN